MLSVAMLGRRPRLDAEHGFTLIELVVAMALGIVVLSSVVSMMYVTWRQAAGTFSMVDATQRARTTMSQLEQELKSACLTSGVTPIESGSTPNGLIFLSAYGNAAQPTPTEHDITFSSASGTLTDNQYAVTGGSAPNWTFSATPTPVTLLTHVAQSGTTPVFQYFAYQEAPNGSGGYYTDGAGNPYMMLLDGSTSVPGTSPPVIPAASPLADSGSGLSSVDAQSAAEIVVTLQVGPSGTKSESYAVSSSRNLTVSDSIVLRLTPPPNNAESGGTFEPCQ